MKNTAKRLVPYAKNGIIHVDDIKDPALRNIVMDRRLHKLLRSSLEAVGEGYDILVPYAVDDPEKQLKRFVQYRLGYEVDLSELRKKHRKYYSLINSYGKPSDVISSWGLIPVSRVTSVDSIVKQLQAIANDGEVWYIGRNNKLYRDIAYRARVSNISVTEYIRQLGFVYKGGKNND